MFPNAERRNWFQRKIDGPTTNLVYKMVAHHADSIRNTALITAYPAMQPEQMQMLQRVYKSLMREVWFDRSYENERDFARIIIGYFQRGISDEDLIFTEALCVARSRFSKGDMVEPHKVDTMRVQSPPNVADLLPSST